MFAYHQLNKKRIDAGTSNNLAILTVVGRIAKTAYEQGATLEEVQAICGAAFGDWDETQNLKDAQRALQTNEGARGY